ncbi:hypothetical protein [Frigidibacter mobilis]|uniref:Uncharacterized protein n=1 Tax=Frigidibacter mobilis TaxID=1335048 RepID=A0A159Z8E2_9RHOB|nr:hypothetical protein [Frigidibacter mobilis]AMY70910.1 hypothetical protein AKL17_3687 [Frigidibacter mobilis]
MAKLFSKNKILRGEEVIPARTVFDATPSEAKQFDALKSARPATADEIKAHAAAQAKADGKAFAD